MNMRDYPTLHLRHKVNEQRFSLIYSMYYLWDDWLYFLWYPLKVTRLQINYAVIFLISCSAEVCVEFYFEKVEYASYTT